ncbi:CoA-transferase family III [Aureobasidium namibiae CBS 147.97]|uniref:CoA-transferase family III n=1 Tax=Aureobasidium namibiae CBS 147.97 TaxID=1043004 RepID=A0A074WE94_9PEZI|nr:CoA-transferase family III [Aureobasidium namibiae CBS 147.97]KEQ68207.1 CoA-transferase family III [Aureobasidium namibiae CBS 147.97]
MASPKHATTEGGWGPGSYVDTAFHSVPDESARIMRLLASQAPGVGLDESALSQVEFSGADISLIPGPLKSQAVSAALQGLIGIVGKEILALKGIDTGKVHVDTDKAGLYPATVALASVDGKDMGKLSADGTISSVGVDVDKGCLTKTNMHYRSWAIYPTKDKGVWYQLMGNLDPAGFLKAYGLDPNYPSKDRNDAYEVIKAEISKYSAGDLELKNMEHGFTGQTVYTPKHWLETTMGKAMARHPVIDFKQVLGTEGLSPVPFPQTPNDLRPLAGVKIIEMARVIAAPAAGAGLAALGADVISIQSPNIPNLGGLSVTLTAGKKVYSLDLNNKDDKQHLQDLLDEADVIVQAFRLGSMDRRGFGLEKVVEMAKKREKGIVYADLSCYGSDGYYAERPGFQQIADAATGCSYVCAKSLGFEEGTGVLPSLPIADMLSGAVLILDVMLGLRDRARYGGSYHAFSALCAVDAFQLTKDVGLYGPETVAKIQETFKFGPMTPDLMVEELLYVLLAAWTKNSDFLKRPEYMVKFAETPFGKNHTILGPIVKYDKTDCDPKWSHGPVPYCYSKSAVWGTSKPSMAPQSSVGSDSETRPAVAA